MATRGKRSGAVGERVEAAPFRQAEERMDDEKPSNCDGSGSSADRGGNDGGIQRERSGAERGANRTRWANRAADGRRQRAGRPDKGRELRCADRTPDSDRTSRRGGPENNRGTKKNSRRCRSRLRRRCGSAPTAGAGKRARGGRNGSKTSSFKDARAHLSALWASLVLPANGNERLISMMEHGYAVVVKYVKPAT